MTFSDRLRVKLQLGTTELGQAGALLLAKRNAPKFKDYLLVMHWIIRSSVPLMRAAQEMCRPERDGMMEGLGKYYARHAVEEMNHDEWLLDDLEAIGVPRQESLSRKPSQAVAELVGSQYYWIYHWHPASLLGYIAVLEGYPPDKRQIDRLRKNTGYPDAAFRTMIKHSGLDPRHRDDLNDLLDSLPLALEHEHWITSNMLYTADKLGQIMKSISS
jgi:hypothetical protein